MRGIRFSLGLGLVAGLLLLQGDARVRAEDAPFDNKRTPLHLAAAAGNLAGVRKALKDGADVDAIDAWGMTPLIAALQEAEHPAIARVLIAAGADVTIEADDGATALSEAAGEGFTSIVDLLLERGATPTARVLHAAARSGHVTLVERFLGLGVPIDSRKHDGETALHDASFHGHLEVVQVLLARGANVNARDGDGETPLYEAAGYGTHEIVSLLLEQGAQVFGSTTQGSTPLHAAPRSGQPMRIQALLEYGADPNAADARLVTPLHNTMWEYVSDYSYSQRNPDSAWAAERLPENKRIAIAIARLLFAHGANARAATADGVTPLHIVARTDHTALAQLLLEHGADINAADAQGGTPLNIAHHHHVSAMAAIFAEHGGTLSAKRIFYPHVDGPDLPAGAENLRASQVLVAGYRHLIGGVPLEERPDAVFLGFRFDSWGFAPVWASESTIADADEEDVVQFSLPDVHVSPASAVRLDAAGRPTDPAHPDDRAARCLFGWPRYFTDESAGITVEYHASTGTVFRRKMVVVRRDERWTVVADHPADFALPPEDVLHLQLRVLEDVANRNGGYRPQTEVFVSVNTAAGTDETADNPPAALLSQLSAILKKPAHPNANRPAGRRTMRADGTFTYRVQVRVHPPLAFGKDHVAFYAGYYQAPLAAAGYLYLFERFDGAWVLTRAPMLWIS